MAYKRMGAILALLSMMCATGAHGFLFGAGDGSFTGCAQDIFSSVNALRAANGAQPIEHLDALARMAQFKADNLGDDMCKVYDNGNYLHYACHGEDCSNTCSNAASLWLSGVKFGGPESLDETRQGKGQYSYELLMHPETRKMGCATTSRSGSVPCSVTVCVTGNDILPSVARAKGKPEVNFWLSANTWALPSNKLQADSSDDCPDLARQGLCGYEYSNSRMASSFPDFPFAKVNSWCKGSCPTPEATKPVVKPPRHQRPSGSRRQQPSSSSRRLLRA